MTTATKYKLSEQAAALAATAGQAGLTLQAPEKGLGKAWRAPQYKAPNTRAAALAAILAAHPKGATAEQAQEAIKAAGVPLGSGTPRSYVVAFVKNGYLT